MRLLGSVFWAAFLLAACAPALPASPTLPAPTAVNASATTAATLPATLTPAPTRTQPPATPAAPYIAIPLSPADEEAYQQALKDIAVNRQGDMQIKLRDANGRPLAGYNVTYHQASHDFQFGGNGNNFDLDKVLPAGINTWTIGMYWTWIEPKYHKYTLDFINYWNGIDELKSGGITLRAQALYIPAPDELPPFYVDAPFDSFLQRLYDHESATVKRFAPSVDTWEAVLEPNFLNHNPMNLTQDQYYEAIATSVRAIRDNDPTARVEINFSYPCGGVDGLDNYALVQDLLKRKIDFDDLGLQFYYNAYVSAGNYQMTKRTLAELSACYDRYEALLRPSGKKIVASEISVSSEAPGGALGYWNVPWSEDTQAQYLTDLYTILFSKPSNLGLVWWNTVEPSSFVYAGGLVRADGTPKKALFSHQRLTQGWTTSGEGLTDASGAMTFRGYGGDYDVEITDPASGARMSTKLHITEQKSASDTVQFAPNNRRLEQRANLEKLTAYWAATADAERTQKGKDYLALVDHHIQASEWALADQTLAAGLEDLAIQTEMVIPIDKLIPVGYESGGVIEDGSAVMWGSTFLHLPYDFPAGTVTVEVKAHGQTVMGEWPLMVTSVGAHSSQAWKIADPQSQVYTYTTSTTGSEQDFTIRFPYDDAVYARIDAQHGDAGSLKLYIDQVKLTIRTTEVP